MSKSNEIRNLPFGMSDDIITKMFGGVEHLILRSSKTVADKSPDPTGWEQWAEEENEVLQKKLNTMRADIINAFDATANAKFRGYKPTHEVAK